MTHTPVLSDSETPHSPPALLGLSMLLRAAFQDEDLTVHVPALVARAENEGDAYAMLDLALILQLRFQKESGLAVLGEALKIRQLFRIASAGGDALRLLVIKTPGDLMTNTPLECLLDDAGITIDVLYVGADLPWPARLPPHDLVFVAISEADVHRTVLERLATQLTDWTRPVLNLPLRIPPLSRDEAFAVLRDVPGICMTVTARIERRTLQALVADGATPLEVLPGITFPIILRPLGSHAGTDLCRIDDAVEVREYLQRVDAAEFFVANFIDYASADGLFRKFRVLQIDGRAFVCHMGVSAHWMVHYPYEEMKAHADRRQEEAAMMASFDDAFAVRHREALAAIHARFGLDYVGFDCAETRDGKLLIFELANALVVHGIDDPQQFPYKAAQMQRVFAAFRDMLHRKALPRT
ncbi:MAG: hypothetical protein WC617_15260 [Rhodanobacter sp.]|jgi:hypothetical protein